ncbi:MDR family oxidoreductase [Gayadomonas joobiniege]|uniref:acrylyl-CoA reductase (NADPH) n=1 Tax=Gayadomonas joobiniege TaxID=1234606 RepID=UPI00037C0C07|nr:MDR family oxidoreductase [Gayadomonas joobiniege]
MFNAIVIEKAVSGTQAKLKALNESELAQGDLLVDVVASTLNYKDALAITGKAPVVKSFPMVPGIDLVGRVSKSSDANYQVGDLVLVNGFGIGEKYWGGLAEKASLSSAWVIPLPKPFSAHQAMAIGTAGYTAMLSVMALQQHGIQKQDGEILVTGANGGVGSFAISLLSQLGYSVAASTGRPEESDYLQSLGACRIIDRCELSQAAKPLQKEQWAGVVDCVGSHTLANALAATRYGGAVTACGLAQGMDLPASVAPFILRGVTLYGIDSVMQPLAKRKQAWQQLAELFDAAKLTSISREISLSDCIATAESLLKGHIRGRVVVNLEK